MARLRDDERAALGALVARALPATAPRGVLVSWFLEDAPELVSALALEGTPRDLPAGLVALCDEQGWRYDPPWLLVLLRALSAHPEAARLLARLEAREETVRVLLLSANPAATARLTVDEEHRAILQRLHASPLRDRLAVDLAPAARAADIASALLRARPDVVHVSGHGTSDGALVLATDDGGVAEAPAAEVAELFAAATRERPVRVVLLHACYSATLAESLARHVSVAIGMPEAVGDAQAVAFAGLFYEALGEGRAVADAYRLACAHVRVALPQHDALPRLHCRDGVDATTVRLRAP